MRYAVSTWNYLKPFGERARLLPALEQTIAAGLGVELWLDWTAEPQLLERERWPDLRRAMRGAACLSAHSRLVHRFDPAVLEEEIQLCAFLGADPLVVHPRSLGIEAGTWDARPAPGFFGDGQRGALRRALRQAADLGVRLALENGAMDLLAGVLREAEGLPGEGQLGICIDTGHANLHRDLYPEPAAAFLRRFAPRLIHLHVSDNRGTADEHALPGSGSIDWPAVALALTQAGYGGTAVLELGIDSPPLAAAQAVAFLEGLEGLEPPAAAGPPAGPGPAGPRPGP